MHTFTYDNRQFEVMGLPRRQSEALVLAAMGNTAKEAARVMGASPAFVEQSLKVCMAKLQARNRVHLVALAFSEGMIRARTISLVLALALAPALDFATDDLSRYTSRHVKVRRGNRDPLLALLDGDQFDDEEA